jgi:hypothetical protein
MLFTVSTKYLHIGAEIMATKQPEPAPRLKPGPKKKVSAAQEKRRRLGLPDSAVDPELSAVRAALGVKANAIRWGAEHGPHRVADIMSNALPKAIEKHGANMARALARDAAPSVVQRMVALAAGEHDAKPREQIAAGRIVLEVAGALEKENEAGEDSPLTQRSVSALRAVIASGEQRIQELQAEIERQAAADLVAIDGVHRTINPEDN